MRRSIQSQGGSNNTSSKQSNMKEKIFKQSNNQIKEGIDSSVEQNNLQEVVDIEDSFSK